MSRKRIIVGITAGIAAYKSAYLVRELVKQGYEVRVVMTPGARAFIQPLTLQALSGNPVRDSLLDPAAESGMGHIELARWADLIVIAPATADFMARVAHGMADDLLSTVCLASEKIVAMVPAMNQAMWLNPATQRNVALFRGDAGCLSRFLIWGPEEGDQACGDTGPGRMLEPTVIVDQVRACFGSADLSDGFSGQLAGKKVVITAGPTREALDPIRYISNHSSGKMGFALAAACLKAGAHVVLISGPVTLSGPQGVRRVDVVSARDMYTACVKEVDDGCDIFIATAAVADYRPSDIADQKIKKNREKMTVNLVRNPDIVASIAGRDKRPFTVGFAAETQNVEDFARDKLRRKALDMIVANDVSEDGIGFNSDENAVTMIWEDGSCRLPRQSKYDMAVHIVSKIADRAGQKRDQEA
ncbi:MAG: bifunctional phosphopantothenoylcysteine decarboxylase/phosphopantothenate--cysteine ligase CoaBC [Gammaproteobacteria bacterium]|nr:MAG: bifunctional phosphopantothenoylcysteine decarboxylase/phosphopantothenate--cysteine ligase CoaBC [Pseudomonadota bacterium]PIE38408.1 MAG: bifunctional phosphopantothenoylcysteine decarboxylase/phosphopantothenate--cysteine ligase CoaBC [Gammaproteobacteria bacterium]